MSSETQRVAIVTGASRGIGRAAAELLSRDGFLVVGVSRGLKDSPSTRSCNVSDEEAVRGVFDDVAATLGRIDVVVNCAGIATKNDDPLEVTREEWQTTFETNLLGTYYCSKHALPHMQQGGQGSIVNVASVAGRSFSKTASLAYTCSKYGVIGLTRQMAATLGRDGIRINCVAPSQARTDMLMSKLSSEEIDQLEKTNPLGRLASPNEVAETICFLASERASYVNGAVLDVNGGLI